MLCVSETVETVDAADVHCAGVENVKVVGPDGAETYGVNGHSTD